MAEVPHKNGSIALKEKPELLANAVPAAVGSKGGGNTARALLSSFTVVLCTVLVIFYGLIWISYPWRPLAELDVPGWIVDFADRVDLTVSKGNPQVVILGSSLTLAAPRRLARPNVYQEELSKRSGLDLTVSCMAVPGAIASDQEFILSHLLAHGKKPNLLIYTYAPRDFMDNTIMGKVSGTPTRRVINSINRRNSFLPTALTMSALSTCFDNHATFIDLVRRHLLRTIRSYVCALSGHPDSLWEAARKQAAPQSANPENEHALAARPGDASTGGAGPGEDETAPVRARALKEDLELYSRRYNPQNIERTEEQYSHLEALLRQGQSQGIGIELIAMPISPANLKLLKPGVYQTMDQRLRALATKYGASLFDLNDAISGGTVKFGQDQFLDSVHLCNTGAGRFVPLFVDTVVQSHTFKKAFQAKATAPPCHP